MKTIIALIFFSPLLTIASIKSVDLDQMAKDYYQSVQEQSILKYLNLGDKMDKHPCQPVGKSCLDTACDLVRPFECDDIEEIRGFAQACRTNYGGGCLEASCKRLGALDCNDTDEVMEIINACEDVYGGGCINSICDRLGPLDCNDTDEIIEVIQYCKKNK